MIIPIRCYTCGKVIANKWKYYSEQVKKYEEEMAAKNSDDDGDEPKFENFQPGFKKKILDDLGLKKMCCRRHVLTHIDLIDII